MARRRSSAGAGAARALAGLALRPAAARAESLLRDRARLLREVQKKKLQLARFRQETAREVQDTAARMAPLLERQRELVAELTALFDELLGEGRVALRARKHLARLRLELELELELEGVLSAVDERPEAGATSAAEERAGARRPKRRAHAPSRPELASAPQPGQERRTLRDLFRSLARAVHPDQARQEPERARRTEVMKEVTRAYEEGDLARLLELESAWQSQKLPAVPEDPTARCQELERINRELLDQLRQLVRELRDERRAARDLSSGLASDELLRRASLELDDLEGVCVFIRRFRDGKLTLGELLRGPPRGSTR